MCNITLLTVGLKDCWGS